MRKYLIIGTSLALLAGGGAAMAQAPQPAPGPQGSSTTQAPQTGQEAHGPGMAQQGHWNMHQHWDMMEHMRHHHERGTSFHFRRGDASIDITCSDNEPVQACVAAAGTLLDKIGSMHSKPAQ